jgi:predicted proteasome-type protease
VTLIVAHVSRSGAVMASDSRVTEEDGTGARPIEKIWTSGGLLFGYSGDLSIRNSIRSVLDKTFATAPLPEPTEWEMAVSQLKFTVKPVTDAAYASFSGGPTDSPAEILGGSLVVVGRGPDGYWLYEIDRYNTATNYTDDGFHTIGSGTVGTHIARRLFSHYLQPGYETKHMRLLAYRFLESCIDALPGIYGIGGEVQMWQSADDGFEVVSADQLAAAREALQQWYVSEQETLWNVAGAAREVPTALPEDLGDSDQ